MTAYHRRRPSPILQRIERDQRREVVWHALWLFFGLMLFGAALIALVWP